MNKLINRSQSVMMLCLITLSLSCASLPALLLPTLENRTLRLSSDIAGFEYQWQVCKRTGLFGKCKEYEMKKETYDLNNIEMRRKLIDMGFVAKVREKIIP